MYMSLPQWLTAIIIKDRIKVTENLLLEDCLLPQTSKRDFEVEWEEHKNNKVTNTWGFKASERLEQLFIETEITPEELRHKTILDAGCGNGLLTEAIADQGSKIIGVDLINNLEFITKDRNKTDNLFFLHADIQNLPFKERAFDLIISNGVLHHTFNTKNSFLKLSKFVKPGGKLYVWLYRKPFTLKNKIFLTIFDAIRKIVSALPKNVQKTTVHGITKVFYVALRIKKGKKFSRNYHDLLIDLYDSFTPRFRHYHHPIEVAGWFYEAGFASPVLSHWDNSFGFGMCATKIEHQFTPPGENYGKKNVNKRLHLR